MLELLNQNCAIVKYSNMDLYGMDLDKEWYEYTFKELESIRRFSNAKRENNTIIDKEFTTSLSGGSNSFFSGVLLLPNGHVFCVPYNGPKAKIYDPITNTEVTTTLTGGSKSFSGGILLPDGRVFCVPSAAQIKGKIYEYYSVNNEYGKLPIKACLNNSQTGF